MRYLYLPLLLLIVMFSELPAQSLVVIEGTVTDAETSRPLPGASIRVESTKRGTYSASNGSFRLPLSPGSYRLIVSSIGYREERVQVSTGSPKVSVALAPAAISLKGLEINAEMDADQIVGRAIDKKEENLARIKTFQGLLYSKFNLEITGNVFNRIKEDDRMVILETFSRNYYDSARGPRISIIQRRQTANIPADQNLFALGAFFSFYNPTIPLFNATIPTPLNRDALNRYHFTLEGRTTHNGKTVYVIGVKPATTLLPAFEGTMKIIGGTFSLIEIDLSPSKSTAIKFVDRLHFSQKFEEFQDDIWEPTYLQVTGHGGLTVVAGLAEVGADFTATSIFTEAQVNAPLPDSVYNNPRIITAAPMADTAKTEFWENNSLSTLTPREVQIYHQVDSLVAALDTTGEAGGSSFGIGAAPYLDFNRVGSISAGASLSPRLGPVRMGLLGAYSFGLRKPLGAIDMNLSLIDDDLLSLSAAGSIFSRLGTTAGDPPIPRLVNTVTAALVHRDYFDYFRQDGWNASVNGQVSDLRATITLENSRQFSENNHTSRSIFVTGGFRPNPFIREGEFRTLAGTFTWGQPDAITISSSASTDLRAKIRGAYGERGDGSASFRSIEGSALFTLPTFGTGYVPMTLDLAVAAGTSGGSLPPQYQFRMPTSVSIIGRFGQFYSAPLGRFGGTEFLALHAQHNFSDILWRLLGLPTSDGRGLEFILAGSTGRYLQREADGYLPTAGGWYSELGFGIGKIPTFISNVVYLRFDARWGIGPLGKGNWGGVVGISSPF